MGDIPTEDKLPRDDRVILTFFHPSDAAALRDVDADPEHRRRFEFPEGFVPSVAHSEKVISDWTRQRTEGGPFVFAVRALADSRLLGGCEIRLLGPGTANLSYFTLPQHRTRGVASRAVALLCQTAFGSLGVRRVEIVVDPDNIVSRRVALRNGFQEVGTRQGRVLHLKDADLPPGQARHPTRVDGQGALTAGAPGDWGQRRTNFLSLTSGYQDLNLPD